MTGGATLMSGAKVRVRSRPRQGKRGDWAYSNSFDLVNGSPPSMTIDSVAPEAPGGSTVFVGWTVFDADRRRGYATETATALMDWARRTHGIRRFVSSTTPENAASLRVHEKLGFRRTGEVVDGEVIFALEAGG